MDFELIGLEETNLDHPGADVVPLITLQLEELSIFRVLHHNSIAGKFLFARMNNFLQVILIGETLNSGQSFLCSSVEFGHGPDHLRSLLYWAPKEEVPHLLELTNAAGTEPAGSASECQQS